ncbi:type IV pilus biogenesis protein PilM [Burkholderia sp. A2]|uniref:type IV pilus biogenesis protein PilM n=1 Tax=Burkholderia sp. A2 TaxID=236253 RepID=UPI00084C7FE5|nr:type IV pilus biogenesis protein PilM [Burkholderia sp. A2]OED13577.1 pilus assembly protein PilM [Burkholderia sp. A2]
MFLIWIVAAFAMLTGAYALLGAEAAPAPLAPSAMALAANMSAYRQAVVAYARANPSFAGSVPAASLAPYLGATVPDPMWRNYVRPNAGYAGSLVVVYAASASASAAAAAAVDGIEQIAQGSALAGVALGANLVSPGNPAVPLPAALANAIPNGMPVWMAQAYD